MRSRTTDGGRIVEHPQPLLPADDVCCFELAGPLNDGEESIFLTLNNRRGIRSEWAAD
jgi:hypothetical protein